MLFHCFSLHIVCVKKKKSMRHTSKAEKLKYFIKLILAERIKKRRLVCHLVD